MNKKDNNIAENKKENIEKKSTKNKKIIIKNQKKFLISILVIVLIIIIIVLLINKNAKKDLLTIEDYSSIDASKYSKELLEKYNTNESKEKFLSDYDLVQGAVGLYIMNNSTLNNNSFETIISNIEEILRKKEWTKLDIDTPSYWNGTWSITSEGIVKFKFSDKVIEPSWKNDEELTNKLVFNDD